MRILGVDHGERRIGLAVTDMLGLTAQPLKTLSVRDPEEAIAHLRQIVRDLAVERIVVGLPLNMDGTEGPQAAAARAFAARLREELPVPVEMQDERLTSAFAERAMLEADLSRARRRKRLDALAAQRLLQTYLERRRTAPPPSVSEA